MLIFTAEYLLRLYAAPSRLKFVPSFLGLIDLAAILSFYIGLVRNDSGDVSDLFIALRIFRALEILKFSSGFRTLNIKMKPLFAAFGFYVLTCIMIAIIFGTFIFMAEKNVDGTNFTSIPAGFLFAFASMTILGSFNMVSDSSRLFKLKKDLIFCSTGARDDCRKIYCTRVLTQRLSAACSFHSGFIQHQSNLSQGKPSRKG